MGKRGLVTLLSLSSWCLMIVVWIFLAVPWVCLQFVIVVFSDHAHLQFCGLLFLLSEQDNAVELVGMCAQMTRNVSLAEELGTTSSSYQQGITAP